MHSREPGQTLGGKYRLMRQLDEGGMGSVWMAQHLTLHSPVALKLINPAVATDPQTLERFLREARTAALLRSPHVVQILDYGVDGDTPYIAMEMLEGESLADRLDRTPRLSVADTARLVRHVARAIGRAHDAGVVHRDLKPENIFIVRNDDDELYKVLDFGIVKTSATALDLSSSPSSTRTGVLLGTPYFMSPEQAEGIKSVDFKADIWALGVIAFRCLLGELPFRGDSIGRVILEICSHPLPVPSEVGPVPFGFDTWFATACARDTAARFGSAKQAADEFEKLDPTAGVMPSEPGTPFPTAVGELAEPLLPDTTTAQLGNAELRPRSIRRRPSAHWATAVVLGTGLIAAASLWFVNRGSQSAPSSSSEVAPPPIQTLAGEALEKQRPDAPIAHDPPSAAPHDASPPDGVDVVKSPTSPPSLEGPRAAPSAPPTSAAARARAAKGRLPQARSGGRRQRRGTIEKSDPQKRSGSDAPPRIDLGI